MELFLCRCWLLLLLFPPDKYLDVRNTDDPRLPVRCQCIILLCNQLHCWGCNWFDHSSYTYAIVFVNQLELLSFVTELSLVNYKMLQFQPLMLAAVVVYTKRCKLDGCVSFNE